MKGPLLLLILVLAALVVGEWWYWPAQPPVYTGPQPEESVEAETKRLLDTVDQFDFPPFDDFAEVSERPLFFEGRRPPSQDPVPASNSAQEVKKTLKPSISLAAVIIIAGESYALIRDQASKTATRRLRAGDNYEGWVVKEVNPDQVILQQGDQSERVPLREFAKVLPPKAAPKRPARAVPKRAAKNDVLRQKRAPLPSRQRPAKKTS